MCEPRTETETLASAMDKLAQDIQTEDGVANAAIHEAAMRLRELQAEVVRLTIDRDNWKDRAAELHESLADNRAIRARVTGLEKEAMILSGTIEAVTTQRQQAEQRVAELVAALTDIRDMPEYDQDDAHRLRGMAKVFLARAESATPAKHPDTDIVDWVEANHRTVMAFEDGSFSCWSVDGHEFRGTTAREVIDAARKQGGEK